MDGITELRGRIVGKWLAVKRAKSGLTQWDVAVHLNYTTAQFISNWERGVSLPPLEAMPRLAALMGVPAKEFIAVIGKYEEAVLALHHREMKAVFKTAR